MTRSTLLRELALAQQVHLVDNVMANDRIAREFGLGLVDMQVLHLLLLRPDVRTAGGVATASGLPTSTVTDIVDRLVGAGFVERIRDEADRRRILLSLTSRVVEVQQRYSASELTEQLEAVAKGFTNDELATIRRWFTALNEAAGAAT